MVLLLKSANKVLATLTLQIRYVTFSGMISDSSKNVKYILMDK